jgi:hypothetical protein
LSRALIGLLGLLVACQGDDLLLGEGALQRDAGSDAESDTGAPASDYSVPAVIEALSGSDTEDDDPSLTLDETELCFNSQRGGGEDIWCATRQPDGSWSAPQSMDALNSDDRETGIALAPDGLTVWFSSDRADDESGLDIYRSERGDRGSDWSTPIRIAELSSKDDDLVSSVGEAERLLFLARRANDDDDYDVLVAERASADAPWSAPRRLDELNTDDEESDGFLAGDGLRLVFTRDEDLVLARRRSTSGAFDPGAAIASLNSDQDDRDAWATPDLRHVVFSSDRDGSYRLYEAFR